MPDNNVSHLSATDAILIVKSSVSPHGTPLQLALFGPDGEAITPLSAEGNVIAHQAIFAGADITALKVELNAFRTKLLASGLMAAA